MTEAISGASLQDRERRWILTRPALLLLALVCLATSWLAPPLYAAIGLASLLCVALALWSPCIGFCLLAFSVPWLSDFALPVSAFPVTLTDALVAALGLSWLARSGSRPTQAARAWLPYVFLFLAAIALSATQAADSHASLREIVKWIELLTVYLAATSFILTMAQLRIVTAAVVVAGVSQALLGYAQFAFQLGPEAFTHGIFLRAYGSFDQPNPYAGYLNMVLPLALTVSLAAGSRSARIWYAVAAAMIAGALLVSQSRGALLATVTALTVVLALTFPRVRSWALVTALALLAGSWLAVLGLVPLGPFERILTAVGLGQVSFGNVTDANFSAVERAAHWLAGVRMFAAHPLLGVGIGNYAVAYPAYHPRGWYAALAHAHNYYINVAAEAGILGLAAYLLLAGSALWYSYATIGRMRQPFCRAVVMGVLGALVATNFHNLFDVLYVHGTVALLGLLMAFVPVSLELGR